MSTSDPIAPERLEALLRGEAGSDGRERRMGALLDELVVGEIAPPSELRERVRAFDRNRGRRSPRFAPPADAFGRAGPVCASRPRSGSQPLLP